MSVDVLSNVFQLKTPFIFNYAYIPAWFEQLYNLSQLALPEPWKFKYPSYEMQNEQTPILEKYINQVFRKQSVEYNYAPKQQADHIFYARNEFTCFHTGLYTKQYRGIYMCFGRNKRPGTTRKWYLKGFAADDSPLLKYVRPLPQAPTQWARQRANYYNPEWEIRIHADHILGDAENVARLPKKIQGATHLPLLLETAAELARRKARTDWNLAVPQLFLGRLQYLLPIHLLDMEKPDLAMALSIMDGYYIGHTCLTLEIGYLNARMFARPTTGWLARLVE